MGTLKRRRIRRARFGSGVLAALLALVSQIALGALVIPDDATAAQTAELAAASVLCTGLPGDAPDRPARQRPHAPDRALCPLSIALAAPAFVLGPTTAVRLPPPRIVATGMVTLPPARGPPSPATRVATPRGPPILA